MRLALIVILVARAAAADRYTVQRGETLDHVAQTHGCATAVVLAANGLTTTLVAAGTVVEVPACSIKARARKRELAAPAPVDDDAKARAALAVIDGASWVSTGDGRAAPSSPTSESVGQPWHGELRRGEQLVASDGYRVRRPSRAYGAAHVIEHLRHAIAEVRALYPDVHTLAIGDLSAEGGGKLAEHRSHQSGLDVDVGFYFTRVPAGYPDSFAPGDDRLDLEATWALLAAFSRTAELDTGVAIVFLDYAVQRRLYDWAKQHGTPDDELAFLLQYPRGKDSASGLVRHWPNHADHFHVRFKGR